MAIRQWFTKKAVKTAENVVEQTKNNLTTKVAKKGEAWFTIGKLVFLAAIVWDTFRSGRSDNYSAVNHPTMPTTININNYIRENERSSDNG